ncbi:hypothetical protein LTR36_002518 [Oleoguttula mirabilis]|uniref:Uncharacterized protein n=1 Tax=Oleoguttula mirabilis TaxID=1507867 RepID=A0AAV9JKH9_9PEZI|nr:hypothetical protein LTR36_002518 [Oleoguttula mirabilis]
MPSTHIELAWATPVNALTLVAHLGAQIKLQPTIDTIHLCNRFGRGNNATITKLPTEIIEQIDGCLINAERERLKEDAAKEYACWIGRCKPTDHLSADQCISIYDAKIDHASDKLIDAQNRELDVYMRRIYAMDDTNTLGWWHELHEERIDQWHARTGYPGSCRRGMFTEHADFVLKKYGLEVWTSHIQRTDDADEIDHWTACYLTMPIDRRMKACKTRQEEIRADRSGGTVPAETGLMLPVAMPRKPSKVSLGRFSRAMKLLSLKVCMIEQYGTVLEAMDGDSEADDETASWVDKYGQEHTALWPELILLGRSGVDEE